MARFDLTAFEWSVIQPLLTNKPRGVAQVDDRACSTASSGGWHGAPWADIPERYGPHTTSYTAGPLAKAACGTGFWTRWQRLTMTTSR